jgi:hypothetical protein
MSSNSPSRFLSTPLSGLIASNLTRCTEYPFSFVQPPLVSRHIYAAVCTTVFIGLWEYHARITISSSQSRDWMVREVKLSKCFFAFLVESYLLSQVDPRLCTLKKRNRNPARSSQNNREQTQKWTVKERRDGWLERRGVDE